MDKAKFTYSHEAFQKSKLEKEGHLISKNQFGKKVLTAFRSVTFLEQIGWHFLSQIQISYLHLLLL